MLGEDAMKGWLWQVALRKATAAAAKVVAGLGVAHLAQPTVDQFLAHLTPLLAHVGITLQVAIQVDPVKMEAALAILFVTGLETGHDWLKLKFPDKIKF